MMIDFLLTENTGSQLLFSYDIMRKAENLMKTLEFLMISKYFCFQKYCFEFSHHKILTISFFFNFQNWTLHNWLSHPNNHQRKNGNPGRLLPIIKYLNWKNDFYIRNICLRQIEMKLQLNLACQMLK